MIAKPVFCGFISANGKTVDNIFTEKQMFYSFYVDVSDISQQLIFSIFGQFTKTKQHETSDNIYRVQIIGSQFANYKVNSIYCKVVNQTEIMEQVFSQGNFNLSKLYFSTLHPYFIHPLHAIIKRNTAYIQNYTTKYKNCFTILKKKTFSPVPT